MCVYIYIYYDVILCYIMLYYVILCYIMLYYVILCYIMLYYVILCYIMLYYVILCYIMLYVNNFTLVLGVPDYGSGTHNAGMPNPQYGSAAAEQHFYLRGELEPKCSCMAHMFGCFPLRSL